MGTVYTVGYKGIPANELREKVESVNGVLVDTRFRPYSPAPMWKQHALRELMGGDYVLGDGRYVHLKGFGNRNYQVPGMENVVLDDPELSMPTIQEILDEDRSPVLLCACTDPFQCHRNIAAQYILHRYPGGTIEIVHWTWRDFPNGKEPKPEGGGGSRVSRSRGGLVIPAHASSMDPEAEGEMRKRRRTRVRKVDPSELDLFVSGGGEEDDGIPF